MRLKAATIANQITYLKTQLGEAAFVAMCATLPPRTRALVGRRLLAVEWIEVGDWMPFQEMLWREHCGGDELAFRRLIRQVVAIDFNGIYRFFLKTFASPAFALNRAAKVWDTYVDGGRLEVRDRTERSVNLVLDVPP